MPDDAPHANATAAINARWLFIYRLLVFDTCNLLRATRECKRSHTEMSTRSRVD